MDVLLAQYMARYGVQFVARLGEGKDGYVLQTDRRTAVKFLQYPEHYNRELRAYRRLARARVDEILNHQIPRLRSHDDALLAFEMTLVRPPFVVDFVSSYTDEEMQWLNFDADVLAERHEFWSERFGDRWAAVTRIVDEFHRFTGLTLTDLSLNNIRFE